MNLIDGRDLVLLDFDGLLVNTEELHFQAYKRMCQNNGFDLDWDFTRFCSIAHKSSDGLKKNIYKVLPELEKFQPDWQVLYTQKKIEYLELLHSNHFDLMPGVKKFLEYLEEKKVKRAVVTNSPREQIDIIKKRFVVLDSIPTWLTREDYMRPKPYPDGYLKAIEMLKEEGDKIIGFEDTLRGYLALQSAGVDGVVVSSTLSDEFRKELHAQGATIIDSFEDLTT